MSKKAWPTSNYGCLPPCLGISSPVLLPTVIVAPRSVPQPRILTPAVVQAQLSGLHKHTLGSSEAARASRPSPPTLHWHHEASTRARNSAKPPEHRSTTHPPQAPVTTAANQFSPCKMGAFGNKKFVSAAEANSFAVRYRASLAKHPFLLFGLPFITIIVAGSFVLTPATAIRYEKHDRKVRQMTREEELGVGKQGRKVNIKDEYYVSGLWAVGGHMVAHSRVLTYLLTAISSRQKLAAKDLDDWEQKRVARLKGESDGTL